MASVEQRLSRAETLIRQMQGEGLARRAQDMMTGGGLVAFGAAGLSWSQRFIVISANGRGPAYSSTGFFEMVMPANGVVIPVVNAGGTDSPASVTVASGGILLPAWSALFYELPVGSDQTSLPGNFKIVRYDFTGQFQVPTHWVLIASRNDDAGPGNAHVRLGTGDTIYTRLAFSFVNGWRNYLGGAVNVTAGYWKDAFGVVHLEGIIDKNGGNYAVETLFQLPVGFRPIMSPGIQWSPRMRGGGLEAQGRLQIDINGNCLMTFGAPANPVEWVMLEGFTFPTT